MLQTLKEFKTPISNIPEQTLVKALTEGLPAGVRTLYFHALQSRVFNEYCEEVGGRIRANSANSPALAEIFTDPGAEALDRSTAEEILGRVDAAGLIRAVSDDLAEMWPKIDVSAVGRLSRPVFAAFVS